MNKQRKAAWYCNTKAANFNQVHRHSTQLAKRVKLEFIRLAAWWRMVLGDLI